MNRYILLLIVLLGVELSYAQNAYFGSRGKISFDRVTYTRARMREAMSNIDNASRRFGGGQGMRMEIMGGENNIPETQTQKMELYFDENHTLLLHTDTEETGKDQQSLRTSRQGQARGNTGNAGGGQGRNRSGGNAGGNMPRVNMRGMNAQKVVYQDLKKSESEIQITIDEKYILSDSLSQMTWRFTDEYRNIAGFECRRVNGATKDSLYLIAYYTDQIPVSAGPALSRGLPGMILGLVIPEMHIQYWATEVAYTNDPVPNDWRDKKSKTMTLDDFSNAFGRYFQRGNAQNSFRRRILEQLIY